ncbi:hypothetical protein K469DRAFT_684149 [Zopfia rhizophila CBS 207.26]|uniref:Uncharacterized protein n=1 Tax=Zopfia rhizophila CBS 207.26 TaxID=1314779 RepID=A0A6A6EAL3_9PEZI|nr:hypothetical protein K469DRAFT_684149 [Zopfia rhizophila CBS 207.26]
MHPNIPRDTVRGNGLDGAGSYVSSTWAFQICVKILPRFKDSLRAAIDGHNTRGPKKTVDECAHLKFSIPYKAISHNLTTTGNLMSICMMSSPPHTIGGSVQLPPGTRILEPASSREPCTHLRRIPFNGNEVYYRSCNRWVNAAHIFRAVGFKTYQTFRYFQANQNITRDTISCYGPERECYMTAVLQSAINGRDTRKTRDKHVRHFQFSIPCSDNKGTIPPSNLSTLTSGGSRHQAGTITIALRPRSNIASALRDRTKATKTQSGKPKGINKRRRALEKNWPAAAKRRATTSTIQNPFHLSSTQQHPSENLLPAKTNNSRNSLENRIPHGTSLDDKSKSDSGADFEHGNSTSPTQSSDDAKAWSEKSENAMIQLLLWEITYEETAHTLNGLFEGRNFTEQMVESRLEQLTRSTSAKSQRQADLIYQWKEHEVS